jgi:hypothetical protein
MMDDIAVSKAGRTRRFKAALHKAFPDHQFSVNRAGQLLPGFRRKKGHSRGLKKK